MHIHASPRQRQGLLAGTQWDETSLHHHNCIPGGTVDISKVHGDTEGTMYIPMTPENAPATAYCP